jgi:hypothetical protein
VVAGVTFAIVGGQFGRWSTPPRGLAEEPALADNRSIALTLSWSLRADNLSTGPPALW